ncbi:precorrin-2 dehydrogenase/sirohydrochlorin ferrochelatase [Xanthomonas sacchari]|uniref:NAD(P)-dependent oxidoreductase n=1 Tax=unclassified Xanthomonas TaxID=2643310 RepID=UPI001371729F|nr:MULTISPECIES: NAD(P)-dependent oxidoreductase [unclassified Xanthomonas]MBB6367455.1 precorrin-2 dehydrogenase/sirohydrochlorin ferrochelatase [Xanthomonas sp. F10]MXV31532.1 siroheme synthase [Xanthomonas sp. LMG 8989]
MPLYPLFADLGGRRVLVVGGGEVAMRKIEALLHAGAQVQVYAHALNATVAQWLAQGRLQRVDGAFDPQWLDEAWLVVAATDDDAFNRQLAEQAGARRKWVNVVDDAALSTFQVPAIIDRDPLLIAISSSGAAPMLARRLRERWETELDHSYAQLAQLFARHRADIRARLPQLAQRRRWFEQVLEGPVQTLLQSGQHAAAEQAFADSLQRSDEVPRQGSVWLVGTGNGDPGALTLKALRALNQADLLLCGAQVSAAVLSLARRDASRQPLPGDPAAHLALLIEQTQAGQRVVSLLPGDAFRQPPHAALAMQLSAAGIACEVVPGVAPG